MNDEFFTLNNIEITRHELNLLLDYITNLQQENERLKEENKHIFANVNDDQLLRSNAMNWAAAQDYKSRCEKAVEYINKHKEPLHHSFDEPDCDYWIATNPQDIIDILNGRSDE